MTRRSVTRRRFLGETAFGAAGAVAFATLPGCGDGSAQAAAEGRTFSLPAREEWKRREVHRSPTRGWSDVRYSTAADGVPSSISLFGAEYAASEFAEVLTDVAVAREVVYAFWDGSFVKQRETVAPLAALADAVGAALPSATMGPFLTASSQTRTEIFRSASAGVREGLVEPAYGYRIAFPRDVALDRGGVVFDRSTRLGYYALAVEGYGARSFVKYFSRLEMGSEYLGPEGTAIDDYRIENIPADGFLDLGTGSLHPVPPGWS